MEWSVLPDFVGFAPLRVSGNPGARNRVGMGYRTGPPVHRLADRYENSVPIRFLDPIDCSKIPALAGHNVRDGRVKTKMLFSIF